MIARAVPASFAAAAAVLGVRKTQVVRGEECPAPQELHMRLAVVVHRHGARTPFEMLPGMPQPQTPGWDMLWGQCRHVPTASTDSTNVNSNVLASASLSDVSIGSDATYRRCEPADMTRKGESQLLDLGTFLRHRYSATGNQLLKGPLDSPASGDVEVTSTNTSRTILSARCVLAGLFPEASEASLAALVQVPHPDFHTEILTAGYDRCHRLRELYWEQKHEVEASMLLVSTKLQMQKELAPLGASKRLRTSVILAGESMKMLQAHDFALPASVSPSLVQNVNAAGHDLLDQLQGRTSLEIRRLGMGPLLTLFDKRIKDALRGEVPSRLLIFSAHDITISSLLTALGLNVAHRWADVGSSVIIEVLQQGSGQWYVRVLYHDGVPKVSGPTADILVPMATWDKALAPLLLTDESYKQACSMIKGSMPPRTEW